MEASLTVAGLFLSAAAVVTDVRTARIPNWLTLGGLVSALFFRTCALGWAGFAAGLLGALLGFGVLLLPFLARGIGGGDVKLMAAAGGWLGIRHGLTFILATAISGGLLALGYVVVRRRTGETALRMMHLLRLHLVSGFQSEGESEKLFDSVRVPYSIAIASGALFVLLSISFSAWG